MCSSLACEVKADPSATRVLPKPDSHDQRSVNGHQICRIAEVEAAGTRRDRRELLRVSVKVTFNATPDLRCDLAIL